MLWHLLLLLALGHAAEYGADVSFPIHHLGLKDGPLGDRKAIYEDYMDGCRKFYGSKGDRCDVSEQERVQMSLRQAQSMVVSQNADEATYTRSYFLMKILLQNYTSTGFMKIRAPSGVRELLTDYWEKNKENKKLEQWPVGNIYTNHWSSPTYVASVEDTTLHGGGLALKEAIWDAAKSTVEQWTGMELKPISQYGIRVYTEGSILNPHVDRLPLVSSCIVNVAQDVDEPWPLEIYDREGNAVNVTMEPGDMVLYESHSLIHGRPFPLKGRYFANIFIHFEPTGRKLSDVGDDYLEELDDFFPPYIISGSPEAENWKLRNPHGWKLSSPSAAQVNRPEGHAAAANGDIARLAAIAKKNRKMLHAKDTNGWQPIHEAARAGHLEVVQMLLEHDVDINARTHGGKGASPLYVAIESLSESHPVAKFLLENGAINIEPEL
jgi:prolyl 4-hydroxylase